MVVELRKLVVAVALAVTAGVSSGAQGAEHERCNLGGKFMVRSVNAYSTHEDLGYTSYEQFRGAELFVPAQPGLTSEWLQRVVSYQIAAGECDFGVRDVTVSVLSAGSGFSVRLGGRDDKAAGEILRHAQQLAQVK
jgi:hypothetical protein